MKPSLEDLVLAHRYLYYVRGEPVLSDYAYDMLERDARAELPETSPVWQVGSDCASSYPARIVELADSIREGAIRPR